MSNSTFSLESISAPMDASPLDALLLETDTAAVALTDIHPLLPEDDDPLHALVAELRNFSVSSCARARRTGWPNSRTADSFSARAW